MFLRTPSRRIMTPTTPTSGLELFQDRLGALQLQIALVADPLVDQPRNVTEPLRVSSVLGGGESPSNEEIRVDGFVEDGGQNQSLIVGGAVQDRRGQRDARLEPAASCASEFRRADDIITRL